jgi:predicted metalloprotease with PDZ domain
MCLDLYLLKLSEGKYGLQNLKQDLMNKYGPEKPFDDEELFDIITEMTFPEIRDFFIKYVEGPQSLPYKEMLSYAGYEFFEKYEIEKIMMIGATMEGQPDGTLKIEDLMEFGKVLKLKTGDILYSVNGEEIYYTNYYRIAGEFEKNAKPGDEVTIVVLRKNKNGELKKKTLKAETYLVKKQESFVSIPMKKPTAEQLAVRKAWINQ